MQEFVSKLNVDVKDFLKGISKAEAAAAGLASSIDDVLEVDDASLDAFEKLERDAKKSKSAVAELEKKLKAALAAGDAKGVTEITNELKLARNAAAELEGQIAEIAKSADDAGKEGKGLGDFFGGLTEKLGSGGLGGLLGGVGAAVPGIAAAGAALAAVGGALTGVISAGKEAEQALKNLRVSTGATAEEMNVLEGQAKAAFQSGVGENVAESIGIIGELRRALGDAVPDDFLGEAATKANAFAKSVGVETPELVAKLSPLIKQYGLTFDEALNQVAATAQSGVADIGGYLDAVQEFTPNAKEAGLSAEEFQGRLQRAAEGGAKDLAKVGDGLKEINNRIKAGDLTATVAEVGGAIGGTLQDIARLGEEGAISTQQVLEQSIAAIDKARSAGEINESTRGELFTLLGGSIAEDLGSELYSKVYGAPIDSKAIAGQAKNAGKIIEDTVAQQDPLDKLQRTITQTISDIGKGIVGFYNEFIAPVVTPIIDGFIRVKDAIANAFAGDGLEGAKGFFEGIQKFVQGFVDLVVNNLVTTIEIVIDTLSAIFEEISSAIEPVIDAFSEMTDSVGDSGSVFETVKNVVSAVAKVLTGILKAAIKIVLTPFKLLMQLAAGGIKVVTSIGKSIYEWAASFAPLQKALSATIEFVKGLVSAAQNAIGAVGKFLGLTSEGTEDAADGAKKAKENTAKWQAEVKRLAAAGQLTEDAIARISKQYGVAAEQIRAFAGAGADAVKKVVQDVNQLAANFTNAMTAAQTNLDKFLAAAAGGASGFISQARAAQKQLRKLEASQDNAAFQIDPVRQAQVKAQRAQAAADTLKQTRELTANLIADAKARETELLKIQQEADAESVKLQIAQAKAVISAGGAGLPEARAALVDLQEQEKRLVEKQQQELTELEGRFQQVRLQQLIDAETRARDAAEAISSVTLSNLQRQFEALDLTGETLQKTIAVQTEQIVKAAEAETRGLIETLPEFAKGVEEINRKVSLGIIDADAAKVEVDKLRKTITDGLLAVAGNENNPLAERLRVIFAEAEKQAEIAAQNARDAFADAGVAQIRSDIVRGIEEQVRGLEKQRDLLLRNIKLTQLQRREIEEGFAKAIDKVRKGSLESMYESVLSITDALNAAVFDLNADEAVEDAENVKAQVDEINKLLAAGEISYQDALDRLSELESVSETAASKIGLAFTTALRTVADTNTALAQDTIAKMSQLDKDRERVLNDTTLTAEQRAEQIAAINEQLANSQTKALEQMAAGAALQFGAIIAESGSAGEALKGMAGNIAKSLLALYTPNILALFSSIIPPPFGLIAGTAAVASLNALLSAALAGFKEGGYTGDGNPNAIAGVVHRKEFVANEKTTAKYRPLLEAMQSGLPIDRFFGNRGGGGDSTHVDMRGVISVMSDVRDRLDSIPDRAFVRQDVGVDVRLDDRLYESQRFRKRVRGLR